MYESGNNQALLNVTGYDHRTFSLLLNKFYPIFDKYTFDEETEIIRPKKLTMFGTTCGRPRELNAIGGLGLVLMWF